MIETMSEQCAHDCATVLEHRPLFDCPPSDFLFRPFLEQVSEESPEFVLRPTNADTGPLAWSIEQALGSLGL
jgi:hypothetical protein